MSSDVLGAVVVGAGQAGLAASYHLKRLGVEHVLLERGRAGESWRTQRWDSFVLNTPNEMNGLPGAPFNPSAPNSFEPVSVLTNYFEEYVSSYGLPLRDKTAVIAARRAGHGDLIEVDVPGETLCCKEPDRCVWCAKLPIASAGCEGMPGWRHKYPFRGLSEPT